MGSSFSYNMSITTSICALLALTVCLSSRAQGQEQYPTTAPPPLKVISRQEHERLDATKDVKARTRTSIELIEARLHQAEAFTSEQRFDDAAAQLGGYQALIRDVLRHLNDAYPDRGRGRDLYKRLELSLRSHIPRLETIRRTTPAEYAVNVRAVADYVKDARSEALNAFYGDTVLREEPPGDNRSADHKRPETTSSTPQSNQP